MKVMIPPRFLRLGENDQWLLDKLREAQANPDQKKRDYLNAWTGQN